MTEAADASRDSRLPKAVWVLAAVAFCLALGFGVMSPILPVYARQFGVSGFLIGLVVSSMSILRLTSMPLANISLRYIGPREVAIVGAVLMALTTAMIGFSDSYLGLLIWRGLCGFGSAMYGVSSMSLLFKVTPPQLRGRASSLYMGGFVIGGMAGPTLGGLLSGVSISFPFFFYAVALLTSAAVLFVFLPSTSQNEQLRQQASTVTLVEAFRDRRFRTSLAMSFANGWQSNGVRQLVVPLFVVENLNLTTVHTGIAFAIAAAVQAAFVPAVGWAIDWFGRRRTLMFGTAVAAITGAGFAMFDSFVVLIVLMCLFGIGATSLSSAAQAMLADTVPATAGSSLSAFQMAGDAGFIFGPLVAGFVMDTWSMTEAMIVGSVFFLIAGVMAWRTPRTREPMLGEQPGIDTPPQDVV